MSKSNDHVSLHEYLLQAGLVPAVKAAAIKVLSHEKLKAYVGEQKLASPEGFDLWVKQYDSFEQTGLDEVDPETLRILPEAFCRQHNCLCVEQTDDKIVVAAVNPFDIEMESQIGLLSHHRVEFLLASAAEIEAFLSQHYQQDSQLQTLSRSVGLSVVTKTGLFSVEVAEQAETSSVIELVDIILADALRLGATDVHIEHSRFAFIVRYRIGGTLIEKARLPLSISDIILRRLLVMSDGKLNERLIPQDTSMEFDDGTRKTSIRMSVLYTTNGYSVVMRLLMPADQYSDLGLYVKDELVLQMLRDFLSAMNGMLIVTGPTSSGKTTTLYSAITAVNNTNNKIITMEDPVEAEIPGLNQVEVQPDAGLDFAQVIKASVRQNPNVLLLGEVRDEETAVMAMRAAITGVMVLTTLHTKNVSSTVLRLLDLGVEMAIIANAVKMIVTQRLARLICEHCKKLHTPTDDEKRLVEGLKLGIDFKKEKFYVGVGCTHCRYTGYSGVKAVFEALKFDEKIRKALGENDLNTFNSLVLTDLKGRLLLDNILKLCRSGDTTLEELVKLAFD
jgi:type II secretory ATPase GspE/PulE/Tfp pilus assembly ATPase PilB-like protein